MDIYDSELDGIKTRMNEIVGELSSIAPSLTDEEKKALDDLMGQYDEKIKVIKGRIWKHKLNILKTDLKNILPPPDLEVESKKEMKTESKPEAEKKEANIEEIPLAESTVSQDGANLSTGASDIVIVTHPVDNKFRFLAVLNDIPVTFDLEKTRHDLMDWFSSLPIEFADSEHFDELCNTYLNKIRLLGRNIHKSLNKNMSISSSFAGLIVGHDKTVIASSGNTNVFCYYEQKLTSLEISNKRRNNPFGSNETDLIYTTTLSNDNYSTIVLSSKGSADYIEDDRFKIICKDTNRESLALEFLDTSRKEKKGMLKK